MVALRSQGNWRWEGPLGTPLGLVHWKICYDVTRASLVAQLVKNLPAMWETWVRSMDWEDPLEKGMATHSGILAWRIPWTVYSPWPHKESDTTEQLSLSFFLSSLTVLLHCLFVYDAVLSY